MKRLFFITIIFSCLLITSCKSNIELLSGKQDAIKMERFKSILLLSAENGFYKDSEYRNSGSTTTKSIKNKLRSYTSSVDISPFSSYKQVDSDTLSKYDYVILPELFLWEDRVTWLNFKPDKVILALTIYDNSNHIMNYLEIKGVGKKATLDFNDPIELVDKALDIYLPELFTAK